MEAIKIIDSLELKLREMEQINSCNSHELDVKTRQYNQIMDTIDNHIQLLDDTFIKTHDPKTKEIAYHVVQAMTNLRKDIEAKAKEE